MVEDCGDPSAQPAATIVVTPWQHFGNTRLSLESIYAFTQPPFALVYVDGNSPPPIQQYLQAQARQRNFTLVRSDRYLTSSEARNIALSYVRTKYVAFVDNGILVTPGWLESLIRCAEETQAWVVGPVYCSGDLKRPVVYAAGPQIRIIEDHGERSLQEVACYLGRPLSEVRPEFRRHACGFAKFHCLLTTKDVLSRQRAFDETFLSYQDHRDFCLGVQEAGGSVYFEPGAMVLLAGLSSFQWSDLPLFLLRWSNAWQRPSMRRFADKWRLSLDDDTLQGGARFRNAERRKPFRALQKVADRLTGWRGSQILDRLIDALFERVLEPTVIARLERTRLSAARVYRAYAGPDEPQAAPPFRAVSAQEERGG